MQRLAHRAARLGQRIFGILISVQVRAGALLVGGILFGADVILHIPRMIVVPGN